MSLKLNLEGKIGIVTGGAQGLGRALALGLAKAGADVVIADSDGQKVKEVWADIKDIGRRTLAIQVDVKKSSMVQKMVDKTIAEFGKIDILCNTTEVGERKSILELTEEEWRTGIDTYLASYHLCASTVAKYMVREKYGKIINVISMFGAPGAFAGLSIYGTSMAGGIMLTKVQATEWAQYNINVNAIAPGWLYTPASSSFFADKDFESKVKSRVPLKRIGQPGEIAPLVVFLASDASNFMTGAIVYVDGGMTALSSGALIL